MWTLFIMLLNWPFASTNDFAYSYLFWIPAGVRWGFTVLFAHQMRSFLKYHCNVLLGMPERQGRLWRVFLLRKGTSLIHSFKSSRVCFIFLPNPDFLVSWGAFLPMLACLYFVDHSPANTKFLIYLPNPTVTELTISRMSSYEHYMNICMSFLPCLRFW